MPWIGIGCPGTINRSTGIVEYANNLYLNNFKLRDMLQEKLGRPVIIENDANAAAYGEYKAGALKGADNAIAITLGTGVGGGIIINGQVYSGSNFAGGELRSHRHRLQRSRLHLRTQGLLGGLFLRDRSDPHDA